jgi:hypothetical protein
MSDKSRGADRLVVGGPPRADLLPPELKIEATLRAQRRLLIGVVIVAVVAVAAVYAFVAIAATTSKIRLDSAHQQTETLLKEQQEYSDVRVLKDGVQTLKRAQILGASTEIDWTDYLGKVAALLPAGTKFGAIDAVTLRPGSAEEIQEGPLETPRIAQINFVSSTPTLPDVSQWIENLSVLPGYSSAAVTAITLDDKDGKYLVTTVLNIDFEGLENRFGNPQAEDEE